MKKVILLKEYIDAGGYLNKLDLTKTVIYLPHMPFNKYHLCPISKIVPLGLNEAQANIYECHVTASLKMKPMILTGKRIQTVVNLQLDSQYI